ncbi:MAG: cytochrome c oxidase subunit II [Chloroflexota bacterium]
MSMPPRSRTGPGPVAALVIVVLIVLATLVALAATGITPQRAWDSFFPLGGATPATDRSHSVRSLYDIVFYIAVAIFVLVEGLIAWTVLRYRRKPGDDELPAQTHGNNLVEVIWTAVPTAIVLFLFVLSWQTLNTVEATSQSTVNVRVIAAQFQFQFDYLDEQGNTTFTQFLPAGEGGGMVVPVGEPVHVILRSNDVIHAFYVPKFLFKRDVVPGKENVFDFTVDEPGVYGGQCAELCGIGHGAMLFEVRALERGEFDAWLEAQIDKANATPAPAPSGEASGQVVQLSALNVQWEQTELTAPADTPFTIHFNNKDQSVPHDLVIKDGSGAEKFRGDLVTGPKEVDYQVPALAAGSYPFVCSVHPNMTGTLTIQ